MSNILWITENFPPSTGGVQSYLFNTVNNLVNFKSVIICRVYENKECKAIDEVMALNGNRVLRANYIPHNEGIITLFKGIASIVKICIDIKKIVNSENISFIIFGHTNFYNLLVLYIMTKSIKIPLATVFHGEDIPATNLKSNAFKRWLISKANLHICNSNFTRDRLLKFCGNIKKEYIAYPGVEDKFFEAADTTMIRSKYGIYDKKVILTIGRLDPRKGHKLVFDALPKIINRYPDILYLIGGTGQQSDYLKRIVADRQLQNHVIFCGFIPDEDIVAFHQLANIFVMPNRILEDGDTEGFGIVFLEANACGKPVIGGACGGALDAIEDARSGYLVDPSNAEELADRIVYLLSNPDMANQMGEYGRQRAWDSFRCVLILLPNLKII